MGAFGLHAGSAMTWRQFVWELMKRCFHGGWKIAHIVDLALVIVFGVLGARTEESWRFLFSGAAVLFAVAFLLGPYWHAYKMYREALEGRAPVPRERDETKLRELVHENDSLKAHLTKVYNACEQIFHLGGGAQAESASKVLDEDILIVIDEDGTGRITEKFTFLAPVPIRNIQQTVYGDSPVSLLSLEFDASDEAGRKIPFLPSKDEPNKKVFLIFFVFDPIPDGPPLTCTLKWKWPLLFQPLIKHGEDAWRWTARGSAPVPRMRFRFKVHPNLRAVQLENTLGKGKQIPAEKLEDEAGYREFVWEMTDVKHGSQIAVKLKTL
jgi:hypothetical protein